MALEPWPAPFLHLSSALCYGSFILSMCNQENGEGTFLSLELPVCGYSFTIGGAGCWHILFSPALCCRSSIPGRHGLEDQVMAPPSCISSGRVETLSQVQQAKSTVLIAWRFHTGKGKLRRPDAATLSSKPTNRVTNNVTGEKQVSTPNPCTVAQRFFPGRKAGQKMNSTSLPEGTDSIWNREWRTPCLKVLWKQWRWSWTVIKKRLVALI